MLFTEASSSDLLVSARVEWGIPARNDAVKASCPDCNGQWDTVVRPTGCAFPMGAFCLLSTIGLLSILEIQMGRNLSICCRTQLAHPS